MLRNRKFQLAFSKITAVLSLAIILLSATSGQARASIAPLSLGSASTYGVLANAAITSATSSSVSGSAGANIGVGGATAPTGVLNYSGALILGGSTLAALTAASGALSDNRGGSVSGVELGAGRTITPGAYNNPTLGITGSLTLDAQGDATAVFIFRSASTLITAASSSVVLVNGAQACNVYWQVGSSATFGTQSTMVGHVIAYASISTGAATSISGQLIATTGAVTLGGTTIINNSCTAPVVTPTPVVTATPTATPVVTATPTATPVVTATPTATPVVTATPTATPVVTATPTPVSTPVVEESAVPIDVTETGGELPATASPWGNMLLIGFALVLLGGLGFVFRKAIAK